MKKTMSRNRKLRAESLESRQLLHGGGMGGGMEDQIARAFDRLDTNDDGVILVSEEGGDEISARTWERVSQADVEGSEAGVTIEEYTAKVEADQAERVEKMQERAAKMRERLEKLRERMQERRDQRPSKGEVDIAAMVERIFAKRDAVDEATGEADGLLSAEELGRHADKLAEAAGEDGMLSADELTEYLTAKVEERNARRAEREAEKEADTGEEGENTETEATTRRAAAIRAISRARSAMRMRRG